MYTINSRFIETPARKLIRYSVDFTESEDNEDRFDELCREVGPEVESGMVRIELTAWQDETEKLDREKIREFYLSAGAADVDVRITRKPRQNIRSEQVLKADTLRQKLVAREELNGGIVKESILCKADSLENEGAEVVLQGAAIPSEADTA